MYPLLESEQWKIIQANVASTFPEKFIIDTIRDKNYLLIVGLDEDVNSVSDVVMAFLSENAIQERTVNVPRGVCRFIKNHLKKEVDKIEKSLKESHVRIDFCVEETGFTIRASREGIEESNNKLEQLTEKVHHHSEFLNKAGMAKMLKSKEGKRMINHVEDFERCTIEISDDKIQEVQSENRRPESVPTMVAVTNIPGGRRIYIRQGDITNFRVSAIVNAANNELRHGSGLAQAIVARGGKSIQDESFNYVTVKGPVLTGAAMTTASGKLPCDIIVHAVGPVWKGGNQREKEHLTEAVLKSMELTESHHGDSIAIPAISTGIFQYPADAATNVITTAVRDYFRDHNRVSRIRDVYFCDKEPETVNSFVKAMQDVFGKINIQILRRHGQASAQDTNKVTGQRTSTLYYPTMKIFLEKGEIAKQKVDVIVNSTSQSLKLDSAGAVSKSILAAAGPQLQFACNQDHPRGVSPGSVAVTTGGNLQCRYVYHTFLESFSSKAQLMKDVTCLVQKCLMIGCQNGVSSMSFPALGTGNLNYPRDLVAKCMHTAIHDYWKMNAGSSLRDVRIVLYDKDTSTISAFEKEAASFYGQANIGVTGSLPMSASFRRLDDLQFGNIHFRVKHGDILQENVHCIIMGVRDDFDLSHGEINQAVMQHYGHSIINKCPQKVQALKKGIAVTHVERAPFHNIIHFEETYFREDWKRTLSKCIKAAADNDFSSVALPILGPGLQGDLGRFLSNLYSSLRDLAEKPKHVNEVHLVINELPVYECATGILGDLQEGHETSKRKSFWGGSKRALPKRSSQARVEQCELVPEDVLEVNFYSDTKKNIDAAKKKLFDAYNKEFKDDLFEHEALTRLDDGKVQSVCTEAQHIGVAIDLSLRLGRIRIQGIQDNVNQMRRRILEICLAQQSDEKAEAFGSVVQWYYEEWKGKLPIEYDPSMNTAIEMAYRNNKDRYTFQDTDGKKHVIDFDEMVVYGEDDNSRKCSIRRKDLIQAAEFDAPHNWEDMAPDENLAMLTVDPSSPEYTDVAARFASTNMTILQIKRIQNITLYKQFQAKRQLFCSRTSNTRPCERELWHGTSKDAIESINNSGFNRSYCGKNAVRYGNGVYFASDPNYSARGQYARPDSSGIKYMYLVDVLTGQYAKGALGMRVPPQKNPAVPSVLFDSVVDDENKPVIFVIFNDTQAYPKYLISFK